MIEKAYFLLELGRIVRELVFFEDVLSVDLLQVKEVLVVLCEHLGRVVEVYSVRSVAQQVPDPILVRVVYPLPDGYFWGFFFVLLLAWSLFKRSLRSDSLDVLLPKGRCLEAAWVSLRVGEPVLAFHEHVFAVPLNRNTFYNIIIGVEFPVVRSKSEQTYSYL